MNEPLPFLEKRAGRVLLLDEEDRLLLFCVRDPSDPERPVMWLAPGGGVEDDESFEDAARRELFEETGIVVGELSEEVGTRDARFVFDGVDHHQFERYFAARVEAASVSDAGRDAGEVASVVGHHWWSLDELRQSTEWLIPAELASWVEAILADRPADGLGRTATFEPARKGSTMAGERTWWRGRGPKGEFGYLIVAPDEDLDAALAASGLTDLSSIGPVEFYRELVEREQNSSERDEIRLETLEETLEQWERALER